MNNTNTMIEDVAVNNGGIHNSNKKVFQNSRIDEGEEGRFDEENEEDEDVELELESLTKQYRCYEDETEVGRQQAPGSCPYCGGKVQSVDVSSRWTFCFLPICFRFKRKYLCSLCSRRLVLYDF